MKLWFEKGAWASQKAHKVARDITPESVNSIAVIRHAAIGDMMVLRPFLLQVKEFFPNAKITLSIVNTYSYGAPEDLVDRIHVVNKTIDGVKTSYQQRLSQISALGSHDLVFDMADTSLSLLLLRLNRSKLKIGFPYRSLKKYLYDITILRSDFVPEVETLLHMIHIFGAPKKMTLQYGYHFNNTKQNRIIYFMGASVPSKQWPQQNFIQLIQKMAQVYADYSHVILEGIGPDEKADVLMASLQRFPNVSKFESLPLPQTIQFLSDSRLVICNDTGIRNIAIASATRTVGIFFSTVPYRYWPDPKIHHAVFDNDGSIPTVESVYLKSQKALLNF
jgi:ADP-heptose:LPS heptosyltransferase